MKTAKFWAAIATTALLAFSGCEEGGKLNEPNQGGNSGGANVQPTVSVEPSTATVPSAGGTISVTVHSSGAWTLDGASDWCLPSKTSGADGDILSFIVSENETPDDRIATFTLNCGAASASFTLTQKQKDALTVSSSMFDIDAEGGEISIEVKANIDFSCEIAADCASWVFHINTKALTTNTLLFQIAANDSAALREGSIMIRSEYRTETIRIVQQAKDTGISGNIEDLPTEEWQ